MVYTVPLGMNCYNYFCKTLAVFTKTKYINTFLLRISRYVLYMCICSQKTYIRIFPAAIFIVYSQLPRGNPNNHYKLYHIHVKNLAMRRKRKQFKDS